MILPDVDGLTLCVRGVQVSEQESCADVWTTYKSDDVTTLGDLVGGAASEL